MPPKYTVVQTKIDSNEEFAKICGDDAEMNFLQDSACQNSRPASGMPPAAARRASPDSHRANHPSS